MCFCSTTAFGIWDTVDILCSLALCSQFLTKKGHKRTALDLQGPKTLVYFLSSSLLCLLACPLLCVYLTLPAAALPISEPKCLLKCLFVCLFVSPSCGMLIAFLLCWLSVCLIASLTNLLLHATCFCVACYVSICCMPCAMCSLF